MSSGNKFFFSLFSKERKVRTNLSLTDKNKRSGKKPFPFSACKIIICFLERGVFYLRFFELSTQPHSTTSCESNQVPSKETIFLLISR